MSEIVSRKLEHHRTPINVKLALLWAALMFLYIYNDYFSMYTPGVIENMQGWATPEGPSPFHGGRKICETANEPFLGSIPMDQTVAISGDEGDPLLIKYPDADAAQAFRGIAAQVLEHVNASASVNPLGSFKWNVASGEGAPRTREGTKG